MPGNRRLPAAPCRVHGGTLGNGESSNNTLTIAQDEITVRAVEGIRGSRRFETLPLELWHTLPPECESTPLFQRVSIRRPFLFPHQLGLDEAG